MKIKLILLGILFWAFTLSSMAQGKATGGDWDDLLNDVKIRYSYSMKYKAYLPWPRFGKKLKALQGKKITLQGFFIPYNQTGDTCVISYRPMSSCFFCTGSGIQTLVEGVVVKEDVKKFAKLKTDNVIKISGTLELNKADHEHLIYILNDVELLKVVR